MGFMDTPIDFGKNFLTALFRERDAGKAASYLADDIVYVTPDHILHLKTADEVLDHLKQTIAANREPFTVDVAAIKSAPVPGDTNTIVYDVNLIPREEENSVNLRCSLSIHQDEKGALQLVFVGMSRRFLRMDPEVIRGFIEDIPGGLMVLAAMGSQNLRVLYCNGFLARKIGISDSLFNDKLGENPFFMLGYDDQRRMGTTIDQLIRLKRPRPMPLPVTVYKNNNRQVAFHTISSAAYKDGDRTVIYVLFTEMTDLVREQKRQLKKEADARTRQVYDQYLKAEEDAGAAEEAARQTLKLVHEDAKNQIAAAKKKADAELARLRKEALAQLEDQKAGEKERTADLRGRNQQLEDELAGWKKKYEELELQSREKGQHLEEQLHVLQEQLEQEKADGSRREQELTKALTGEKEQAVHEAEARAGKTREELEEQLRRKTMEAGIAAGNYKEKLTNLQTQLRTARQDLMDEKLAHARKNTDEAVRSKERSKSLSRMKQLITGQMKSIQKLAAGPSTPDEMQDALKKVTAIADTTPVMADDLQKISILDPEKHLKESEFSLRQSLDTVRRVIWPACQRGGVIFTQNFRDEVPDRVIGSKAGLQMVLLCILENAVRNSPRKGSVSLAISADPAVRGRAYFHFVIEDKGNGIPDMKLPGLFDKPTKELAISRRILGMMGGGIQVRSSQEQGTVFEIRVNLELAGPGNT